MSDVLLQIMGDVPPSIYLLLIALAFLAALGSAVVGILALRGVRRVLRSNERRMEYLTEEHERLELLRDQHRRLEEALDYERQERTEAQQRVRHLESVLPEEEVERRVGQRGNGAGDQSAAEVPDA